MNDVIRCLLTRRSVKKYRAEQVEEEKLEQILQAGSYAACGMGKQAGKIVVLQDPADIAQLEKLNAQILGNPDLHPFYGAPTVCVVFADTSVGTWVEDGSLVIGNMLAAAHSLGVGSCWIHRARQEFELPEGRQGAHAEVGRGRALRGRRPLHPRLRRGGARAGQGPEGRFHRPRLRLTRRKNRFILKKTHRRAFYEIPEVHL